MIIIYALVPPVCWNAFFRGKNRSKPETGRRKFPTVLKDRKTFFALTGRNVGDVSGGSFVVILEVFDRGNKRSISLLTLTLNCISASEFD
jgi:hypothetical protein